MINLKVRLRNPVFWATIIPALLAFIYSVLGAFDVVPAVAESEVVNIITAIISALTTIGVLNDPTTAGISDSEQAMTYAKPKED